MRKNVKRMLDRVRIAASGMFGKQTSTHDGLQEAQQMETVPVPEQARP